eukprot:1115039-Amphidinium_carterae.1
MTKVLRFAVVYSFKHESDETGIPSHAFNAHVFVEHASDGGHDVWQGTSLYSWCQAACRVAAARRFGSK